MTRPEGSITNRVLVRHIASHEDAERLAGLACDSGWELISISFWQAEGFGRVAREGYCITILGKDRWQVPDGWDL
jgi:hypothetical protein